MATSLRFISLHLNGNTSRHPHSSGSEGDDTRRIRLGSDGNLYLGDKLYGATTDREKAALRSFTGMLGNGGGAGAGGAKGSGGGSRTRSHASPIDPQASISKQTIQALRYLFKSGQLTRGEKEILLMDIIDHVVQEGTSLVVVAYELLVVKAKDSNEQTRPWSQALVGGRADSEGSYSSVGLEEFADQCKALSRSFRDLRGGDEDEEDDDEDDDEDEDEDGEEEQEGKGAREVGEWYTVNDKGRGKKEPRIAIDDFESGR